MTKWQGGKGSKQRPADSKNPNSYQDNWERIFGKKTKEKDKKSKK